MLKLNRTCEKNIITHINSRRGPHTFGLTMNCLEEDPIHHYESTQEEYLTQYWTMFVKGNRDCLSSWQVWQIWLRSETNSKLLTQHNIDFWKTNDQWLGRWCHKAYWLSSMSTAIEEAKTGILLVRSSIKCNLPLLNPSATIGLVVCSFWKQKRKWKWIQNYYHEWIEI